MKQRCHGQTTDQRLQSNAQIPNVKMHDYGCASDVGEAHDSVVQWIAGGNAMICITPHAQSSCRRVPT